jgi:hypothetical protein
MWPAAMGLRLTILIPHFFSAALRALFFWLSSWEALQKSRLTRVHATTSKKTEIKQVPFMSSDPDTLTMLSPSL